MSFKRESELTAYISAIDQALREKNMQAVNGGKESELIQAMFDANRVYSDCVDAVVIYRNKGLV